MSVRAYFGDLLWFVENSDGFMCSTMMVWRWWYMTNATPHIYSFCSTSFGYYRGRWPTPMTIWLFPLLLLPLLLLFLLFGFFLRIFLLFYFFSLHSMKSIMNGVRFALLVNRWKLWYAWNEQARKIGISILFSIRYVYEVAEYLTIIHP